jgi:HPt (histidine-containing phosphotransfer) domain-containing protein
MDDYVSKPVRDDDLLRVIRQVTPAASAEDTFSHGRQDTGELMPAPAAFDEAAVLGRVGGNRAVLRGLIEVFYQDCNTQMGELDAAIRDGDADRVRAAGHTIKGMVSFFGAGDAVEAARRVEAAGERGELAGVRYSFSALARELDAVAGALAPFSPAPPDGCHFGRGDRAEDDVFSPAGV